MMRHRLPNRRPAMTEEIAIDGAALFTATIGFGPDGGPAEVFLSGGKAGSTLATILGDAAVLISIALQHGIPAAAIGKSIARLPDVDGASVAPASPGRRGARSAGPVRTGLPMTPAELCQRLTEMRAELVASLARDGIARARRCCAGRHRLFFGWQAVYPSEFSQ
jgi:hypothetical protein